MMQNPTREMRVAYDRAALVPDSLNRCALWGACFCILAMAGSVMAADDSGAGAGAGAGGGAEAEGLQAYQVLSDRNIFSRTRGQAAPPAPEPDQEANSQEPSTPAPEAPPPPVGSYLILRGVSLVGDRATALVEDQRNGQVHLIQEGSALADHEVLEVGLDAIIVWAPAGDPEPDESRASSGDDADPAQATATDNAPFEQPSAGASSRPEPLTVDIGQNLLGKVPQQEASSASPGDAAGQTGAASSDSNSSAQGHPRPSADDAATNAILERLRRRRQEELSK